MRYSRYNPEAPKTLEAEDFRKMTLAELFGWFCMAELDSVQYPNPVHYQAVYAKFQKQKDVVGYLASLGFIK